MNEARHPNLAPTGCQGVALARQRPEGAALGVNYLLSVTKKRPPLLGEAKHQQR
ncbi:expressed unknown protein [Ectocarpus siliculosus]|uniref:Uncharacterized protein n=1 Tax=Ectocarpus siliculosus TaxID=2880 RepID=D8LDZ9_ECTSI|nr:expressed unknown protein [Ectocarpus siliculosus]|eukprot:CBN75575.1 expressed unknown protein [Ectocarpus siliculosus]